MEYISAKYNADLLTVDYLAGDGSHLLRSGGTAAWRFNNPGNLRPRGKKILYGAIGIANTKLNSSFLIFSSYEEGRKQKKLLLRRKYNDRTIYTMLAGIKDTSGNLHDGYAPASDNNDPEDYANTIAKHIGKPISTKLSDLSDAQLDSMMDAMEKKEGYHGKRDTRKEVVVPSTSITVSDGARPQSGIAAKVLVDGKEQILRTDSNGRLPSIPHVKQGSALSVCLANPTGEWQKVYDGELGSNSQVLGLFNSLELFDAPTDAKEPPPYASKTKRAPVLYEVVAGDTLGKIAKLFETTVAEIQRDNPQIKDISKIFPTQRLSIYGPGATTPAPLKAPPALTSGQPATGVTATPAIKPPSKVARPARSKEGTGAPLAILPPDQKQAPWMHIAVTEAKKWQGQSESIITKTSNYHALTKNGWLTTLEGDKNAWCASFVNFCLNTSSPPYKTWKVSYRARNVALDANFVEIDEPVFGAIMLQGTHHVAFVYAKDRDALICLGGNQSNQINFSPFKKRMRFFVPIAYSQFAKQQLANGTELPQHSAAELNTAFGIKVKVKTGNSLR